MLNLLRVAAGTGAAALRANPVRALLAMLGVVIGSAALSAVLSVGDGVERYARSRAAQQGFDRVVLRSVTDDTVDGQRLQRAQVTEVTLDHLTSLAGVLAPREVAVLGRRGIALTELGEPRRQRAIVVQAVAFTNAVAMNDTILAGRHLTADETQNGDAVAVVDSGLARVMLGDKSAPLGNAVGQMLQLGEQQFAIAGVDAPLVPDGLPRDALRMTAPFSRATSAFVAANNTSRWPVITVRTTATEETTQLKQRVEAWLTSRDANWRRVLALDARAESQLADVRRAMIIFKILMGSITGITLLVGGIGIMNVLLASVAERTREIGVRKAVGAKRRDILWQFLAESLTISGVGSVVGTALGIGAAYIVTAVMRAQTQAIIYAATTVPTLLISTGIALIVGIAFGCYPAIKAARLSPIDAIHIE